MKYTNEMMLTDYQVNAKDFFGDTARFIDEFRSIMEDNQALREENAQLKAYIAGLQAEQDSLCQQMRGQSA